ncbi:hypothetical protein [Nakamurella aerolata]|uniref:Membrane protein YfhO n=1 Tax=Nakamurella aerolata TaxID=1656892 RepID=A0A849A6X3_9ACTN|nr:hypothetical protein [Nakamurella aerolata]NNG36255.1 hypothetical protein [Nakamurella aerolata]
MPGTTGADTASTEPGAPGVTRRRTGDLLVVSAVVAMLLALIAVRLGPSLLGSRTFTGTDLLRTFAPWANPAHPVQPQNGWVGDSVDFWIPALINAQHRLWQGDIPLWVGAGGPGSPLLAVTNLGLLTPLSIWPLLLPPEWAMGLVKLLQLIAAFTGMTLWLRRVGLRTAPAAAAGLLYLGTGFFVSFGTWVPQATTAALLPALLWTVERLVQRRTLTSALPVAVVTAFLVFAGFPAVAGHALYAGAAYFIVRLLADRRPAAGWASTVRTGLLGVGAVLVGVAVTAFQLLGLANLLSQSETDYRAASFFDTLPMRSLVSTVLPRAFLDDGFEGTNPVEAYAYVGAGTVLLSLAAIVVGRRLPIRRGVLTYLAVGALFCTSVIWFQGFWTDWLGHVPVFAGSLPGRLRGMLAVFVCALAGIGLAGILQRGGTRRQYRSRAAVVSGLAVVGVATLVYLGLRYSGRGLIRTGELWADVGIGIGVLLLLATAAWLSRRTLLGGLAAAMAIVLSGVQIVLSTANFWPTSAPTDFYQRNDFVTAVQQRQGTDRVLGLGAFFGSTGQAYDIRTVSGHTFQPAEWSEYLTSIDPTAYTGPWTSPTSPRLSLNLNDPMMHGSLLDRLGVALVALAPGERIPGIALGPDGKPPTESPWTGRQVTLDPGESLSRRIAAVDLQGVRVNMPIPRERGEPLELRAEIFDADGTRLTSGWLKLDGSPAGWVTIPVTGWALSNAKGPLRLKVTSFGDPVGLSVANGAPAVQLISPDPQDQLRLIHSDEYGTLWQRLTALPRIRWAADTEVIADPQQRLQRLASPQLSRSTVVLSAPGPAAAGRPAEVTVTLDSDDRMINKVRAKGAGYLVVADPLDPEDWEARVDGTIVPLVRADHAFVAVAVPAGEHTVEIRFVGRNSTLGLAISGSAVLVLLAAGVTGWVLRRRRRVRTAGAPPG